MTGTGVPTSLQRIVCACLSVHEKSGHQGFDTPDPTPGESEPFCVPLYLHRPQDLLAGGICSSQSRGLYLCVCVAPGTGAGTGTATKLDVLECGAQASDLAKQKHFFTVNKLVISPQGSVYANTEVVLGLVGLCAKQIHKCFLQLEILTTSNALAVTCFIDGLKNGE